MASQAESDKELNSEVVVEARGLSVTYQGAESSAVREFDLDLRVAQAVALVGHTGAGKSTFLKCLNGLIPHFQRAELSGSLSVFGLIPMEHTVAELAGRVGIVFQEFENQLFSTNVEQEVAFGPENLAVDPDEIRSRVTECLELVGLSGFENREPATLSGGEKQRLAIASVVAMKPDLLLLDEPTTDLDPDGKASVHRIIRSFRETGATILLVEHGIESVLDFDSIALMRGGRMEWRGHPPELCVESSRLSDSGVRPHPVAAACQKLGLNDVTFDVSDAHKAINEEFLLDRQRYEKVVLAENERIKSPATIEVQGLSHAYERGKLAVQDVSLSIAQGESVAIVGRNGSGKTTFVKHLNALLKPITGKALFHGKDVSRMKISEVARHVGLVFQNPDSQIFCETVEEEVKFGPRNLGYSDEQIERLVAGAIETVDLQGMEKSDPFCLTKGERQRTAIASTLSCDPDVLILDEPTTGLDYTDFYHSFAASRAGVREARHRFRGRRHSV